MAVHCLTRIFILSILAYIVYASKPTHSLFKGSEQSIFSSEAIALINAAPGTAAQSIPTTVTTTTTQPTTTPTTTPVASAKPATTTTSTKPASTMTGTKPATTSTTTSSKPATPSTPTSIKSATTSTPTSTKPAPITTTTTTKPTVTSTTPQPLATSTTMPSSPNTATSMTIPTTTTKTKSTIPGTPSTTTKTVTAQLTTANPIKFKPTNQPHSITPASSSPLISFIFVGDIMMDRKVGQLIANNSNDTTIPFKKFKSTLTGIDIKVANLESGITTSEVPLKKIRPCSEAKTGCCDMKCFFNVHENILSGIVDYAGFNLLTIENNHIDDYVNERQDTRDALTRHRTAFIDYFNPFKLANFKGCNLEFYGYDLIMQVDPYATMKAKMQDQMKNAPIDSFKIYYVHGGKEYDFNPTANQMDFARAAIDAGADIVIFSHSHVIGQHEVYNGKNIVYGLGNFVFDQRPPATKKFYALRFDVENCKNVINFKLLSGTINGSYQPSIDMAQIAS